MAPSSTPANVQALLPKLNDADADIRYMSLSDLHKVLVHGAPGFLTSDYLTCTKAVEGLLKTLDDGNGEVQNQAIKCLGALVVKLNLEVLDPLVEKVSNLSTTHSQDNSIRAAALRTFVTAFPPPILGVAPSKSTQDAYSTISKVLIPRLVGYVVIPQTAKGYPPPPRGMLEISPQTGADSDAIDVLIEVVRCFGPMLQDIEKQALQKTILIILDNERTGAVTKKKAVVAMSTLALYLPDRLLNSFVSSTIQSFRAAELTAYKRRLLITVIGSLVRFVPQRMGPYLNKLVPFVLGALSQKEYEQYKEELADAGAPNLEVDEVHETALVTLETLLACCSNEMRSYTDEAIAAALRYIAYDPNIAEDDEEMGGTQDDSDDDQEPNGLDDEEDQDFEEEADMSDDEDTSWKIRRCAAKVLYVIVSTRSNGDLLDAGLLYGRIAPTLIKRFQEREENVRLEILATLALLVRKTGQGKLISSLEHNEIQALDSGGTRSRKRRRVSTSENDFDSHGMVYAAMGVNSPRASPPPASGPKADLARIRPAIVQGVVKLLKQGSASTKQAGLNLLRDLALVQNGALSDHLTGVVDIVVNAISSTKDVSSAAIAAAGNESRIDALQLSETICDTHSSRVIAPYLGKLVPVVISAAAEKTFKVSLQGLLAVESLVKVLTPPRSANHQQQYRSYISDLYDVILDRATTNEADLEVRQRAIQGLGVLLARTSAGANTKNLPPSSRSKALGLLLDRLKNETTRLAATRAIDTVAVSLSERDDNQKAWVREVVLELAVQLRKSDRILRGASLVALKNLAINRATISCLDTKSIRTLCNMLLPVINVNDLNLLGLALTIVTRLVDSNPQASVDNNLNQALCVVVVASLSGQALDALLALIKAIGEANVGKSLMKDLLNVGISGDPAIVGKAIGALLVAGGPGVGVSIDAFVEELKNTRDNARKCLALYILGEVGLRLGSNSPLEPKLFSNHFNADSDSVPRAAAVAFGRAGAGNINVYLPAILQNAKASGNSQYLSLHAMKEILQYAGRSEADISPYLHDMWERLLSVSKVEDNKAVGAECIGRLIVIAPRTFLPRIQALLRDPDTVTRGMVIQAIRFTFAEGDESFDEILKPVLTPMLITMLQDPSLENRRLALSTIDSATRNKPDFVHPDLPQLIPFVLDESKIKPGLIREVTMGPFKHKVDDGLEVRKSAYETLYSLMKHAFARISTLDLFDRVIAGIEDEHEIKVLCNLMLRELITLDAEETQRRLDSIAEAFKRVLSIKPKDNAVKQELEKLDEARKGVMKVSIALNGAFSTASTATAGGQAQAWQQYWEWICKDYRSQLTSLEADPRAQSA